MLKIALLSALAAVSMADDTYGAGGYSKESYTGSPKDSYSAHSKYDYHVSFNPKSAVCDRDFLKFVTELASHFQSSIAEAFQNFQSKFAIAGGFSSSSLFGSAEAEGKAEASLKSFPFFRPGQITKANAYAYFEAEASIRAARFAAAGALAVDNTARGFVPVVKLLVKSTLIALKAQIVAVCECSGYGMKYKSHCPYWVFLEKLAQEFSECASGYIGDMDVNGAHNDAEAAYNRAVTALRALPAAEARR